ncbi:hypothetical protein A2U01_0022702, partial [Trifolium medium]|nr:hypothetical protein [Trifolium medium]
CSVLLLVFATSFAPVSETCSVSVCGFLQVHLVPIGVAFPLLFCAALYPMAHLHPTLM